MLRGSLFFLSGWLRGFRYYGFLAFFVPFLVRWVPEILSWPYLLGLDTLRYVPIIEQGQAFAGGFFGVFCNHLFYSLGSLFYWLVGDGIFVVKFFGPLLLGLLSFVVYLYARRVLCWGGLKSFVVALLVGTYFVSLRVSWDLYSQSLGLVFLFVALVALRSVSDFRRRYVVTFVFVVLTVLGHELAAVLLFVVLGVWALQFLVRGLKRDFVCLGVVLSCALVLFLLQRYLPSTGGVVVPVVSVAKEASLGLVLHMGGLLVYCYLLVLPFVVVGFLGLKDLFLRCWVGWCLGVVLLTAVSPTLPLYYWNRWVYLLVYPLLFFAVHGLETVWVRGLGFAGRFWRLGLKFLLVAYLGLLLLFSGFYLTLPAERAFFYYSECNPYLAYIPSSMLQSAVSVSDMPSLVACMSWLGSNAVAGSVVVEHYALYDLALLYLDGCSVVAVREGQFMWEHLRNESALAAGLVWAAEDVLSGGSVSCVYTVWWVGGKGWYGVESLPSVFFEVHRVGDMAVYVYNKGC